MKNTIRVFILMQLYTQERMVVGAGRMRERERMDGWMVRKRRYLKVFSSLYNRTSSLSLYTMCALHFSDSVHIYFILKSSCFLSIRAKVMPYGSVGTSLIHQLFSPSFFDSLLSRVASHHISHPCAKNIGVLPSVEIFIAITFFKHSMCSASASNYEYVVHCSSSSTIYDAN